MAPNISPCKGCEDRHTACHDHCVKYAQWKEENRKIQAKEKEYIRHRREDFLHSEECRSPKKKHQFGKNIWKGVGDIWNKTTAYPRMYFTA